MIEFINRLCFIAGRIFNRSAHQPHLGRQPDRLCRVFRRVSIPVLKIRRNRQVRRFHNAFRILKRLGPAHRCGSVLAAQGKRQPCARRRERLILQTGQNTRRARIPRVADHERLLALVQRLKIAAFSDCVIIVFTSIDAESAEKP